MGKHIHKRHNKGLLLYHLVCPIKYRRSVLTAREVFRSHPEVKDVLWGGQFWSDGYYSNTVGQYANEEVIKAYLKNQGKEKEYRMVH